MSDLVGNPEDRFSHNEALLCYYRFQLLPIRFAHWLISCLFDQGVLLAGDKVTSHVSGNGGRTYVFHPRVYTQEQARANGEECIRLQFQ